MGIEKQLAKLTAGVTMDNMPGGGIPEITASDVAAALGYARGRVPMDRFGAQLVLARDCLCPSSQQALQPLVLNLAWSLWLEHRRPGLTSVAAMTGLARLAVFDWCHTEWVRRASESAIAEFVGVHRQTWRRRYQAHYGCVISRMHEWYAPVRKIVIQAIYTGTKPIKKT